MIKEAHNIQNIYQEGELTEQATVKEYLTVQKEGSRQVSRMVDFYNLDMIISVGYRIKSHVAARFRQWATQRLREYIIKGFVLDDERLNAFLSLNERAILEHAGKISNKLAQETAETEYEKFNRERIRSNMTKESDFDKAVMRIESKKKQSN
ncbi:virulence RhuM family protein [candidate division KSB1 bacterium]|nr:virulence RhuM family protein [candidate division KSB1 bacterium]